MPNLSERLKTLSSAEDFFHFFGLPFDVRVVQVNRLHILKRFHQYLHTTALPDSADEVEQFRHYRVLLARAYEDFVRSTPAAQKVFKVFQDAGGTQHVHLALLRDSLPGRAAARTTPRADPARA